MILLLLTLTIHGIFLHLLMLQTSDQQGEESRGGGRRSEEYIFILCIIPILKGSHVIVS